MDFLAKNKFLLIILFVFIGGIVFFTHFERRKDFNRRVFYFETTAEDKIKKEYKYLKKDQRLDYLQQYIEELLLGPFSNSLNSLFSKETRVKTLFVRNKSLYIELSDEALQGKLKKLKKTIAVFRKNIYTNFKNIDIIHVYIAGNEVYAE
ncbi:MAG: GerMN domain-containing protein [Treponemataceae bacterium]